MSAALDVLCRSCCARPGQPCRSATGLPHATRERRAEAQPLFDEARSVECPRCGMEPGEDCFAAKPHWARLTRTRRWAECMEWLGQFDTIDGIPVIPVTPIQRNPSAAHPDAWLVGFLCGWCRKNHTHGAYDQDFGGAPIHRVAHCATRPESPLWERGYYLQVPAS